MSSRTFKILSLLKTQAVGNIDVHAVPNYSPLKENIPPKACPKTPVEINIKEPAENNLINILLPFETDDSITSSCLTETTTKESGSNEHSTDLACVRRILFENPNNENESTNVQTQSSPVVETPNFPSTSRASYEHYVVENKSSTTLKLRRVNHNYKEDCDSEQEPFSGGSSDEYNPDDDGNNNGSSSPSDTSEHIGDVNIEEATNFPVRKGKKGKKKQSSQEQPGPSGPPPVGIPQSPQQELSGPQPAGVPQTPQPSTSRDAGSGEQRENTPRTTGSNQPSEPRSDEWVTKSSKGAARSKPVGTTDQPGFQEKREDSHQSGRGWEKSGDRYSRDQAGRHERPKTGQSQASGGSQQPGQTGGQQSQHRGYQQRQGEGPQDRERLGQAKEQQWKSKGQNWRNQGQEHSGGQQQRIRGHEEHTGGQQQRQRGQQDQWPSREQQQSQRGQDQWPSREQQQRQRGQQDQWPSREQQQRQRGQQDQWPSREQQQSQRGQDQWPSREQQQRQRGQQDQWPSREQQQRQRGQQDQWPSREQQRRIGTEGQQVQRDRPQFRDNSRPTEEQYQSHGQQNVWPKKDTSASEDTRQKLQTMQVTKAPNVWDKKKRDQTPQEVEGAPDKVQVPSTSKASPPKATETDYTESKEPTFPLVPVYKKPGTLARKRFKVQSNHFALDLGTLKEAYHYDVEITEFNQKKKEQPQKSQEKVKNQEKVSKGRRIKDKVQYRVMQAFLDKYFRDRYPSFDGKKNLYASKPLTNDLNQVLTDTDITVLDDFGKEKTFSIQIQYVKTISLVPEAEAGSFYPPMLTQNAIQCIDIVLRNAPIRCFNQIGSSFFSKPPTDGIIELGGGMEMYYGFYQSVITGGRPFLNVHLVHKAFPKKMPVLDAFIEVLDKNRKGTYNIPDLASLPGWQVDALNKYIENLKVAYELPRSTKVIYRVNSLVRSPKEETMVHNGTKKTILEYYRTEKGYTIKNPDIPLLWVGNPKGNIKILIPPELCTIEKDQSVKRKMEDFQTRNMIKEAATDTKTHKKNTLTRFNEAGYNASPYVQEFKFSVNDKFEVTDARILPTPQLQYDQADVNVKLGKWDSRRFETSKEINKWAVVDISNDRYVGNKLNDFVRELKNAARSLGVNIQSEPVFDKVPTRSRFGPTKTDLEQYFKNQKSKNYDIIFVIIPSTDQGSNVYSFVKTAAELTAGCLTQCVKSKTITGRFNMSTAVNILLKVNGKLDGVNHTFTEQCKPKLLKGPPVMIMGADVTHPPPKNQQKDEERMPSVAAVIASHDPKAFKYNLCLRLQEPKMEYIVDLKAIVKEQLLFYYKKNNGIKPAKIVFFRDGVSEGQFQHVLDLELTAIKDACKDFNDYNPTITFLVVQKRHHTRLFPLNDRDSEDQDFRDKKGNYNVPAGTCVDTNIVNPTMQNFYLVSHASLKGVSRPTKYCTLWDDLDLSNDEIQELSYYLCHMFARCNRSVSYPAPTYYAHLGALRGKAYIKPALDSNSFDMQNLQKEMQNIKTQSNILNDNPMFFI